MAAGNSILKLKVDSTEYDANIKKAAEGIQHLAKRMHDAQGDFEGLDKAELDFIKDLQYMTTVSKTASGQYRELENAYKNLAATYEGLSAFEKQGDAGKALSEQLEILKKRTLDMKANMDAATQSLQSNESAGQQDSSMLAQLASKFTINVDALKLFSVGLQAVDGALGIAKDAFFASEQNLDDWNRAVYSAESVYQGFLTALNTGDIGGFLDNINTIVKAANEAYNALDRLGTMKTIDTPQLTAKQSEIHRMQTMLRTGRWIDRADGMQSSLGYKAGDVLPKEVLATISQQLKSAMGEVADIMKQEIGAANTAIDALYKEQAARLGMSNKQFKEGTASMAAFEENLKKAKQYLDFEREHTTTVSASTQYGIVSRNHRDNVANPYEQYKGWAVFKDDGELYQRLIQEIRNRASAESQYYGQVGQAYRGINRVEKVGGSGSKTTPSEQAATKFEQAQKDYQQALELAALQVKEGTVSDVDAAKKRLSAEETLWKAIGDARDVYDDPSYRTAQQQVADRVVELGGSVKQLTEQQEAAKKAARELEQAERKQAQAQEKMAEVVNQASTAWKNNDLKGAYTAQGKAASMGGAIEIPVGFTYTQSNLDAFTQKLKQDLANADVGSLDAQKLLGQLNDATTLRNIMTYAIQQGMDMAQLGEVGQQLWKRIFTEGGDILPEEFKNMLQSVSNATGKDLTLSGNGSVTVGKTDSYKEFIDGLNKTTSGLSSVSGGLKQLGVDIPKEVDDLLNVLNAVGSIISGVQQVISVFQVSAITANTAAIMANNIALGANSGSNMAAGAGLAGAAAGAGIGAMGGGLIGAAIGAGVGFLAAKLFSGGGIVHAANGFVVPGNSFSGDNVPALLNSGEVVLNHSQVNNLAAELSGGGQIAPSQPYVTGELIFLGANNHTQASGQGEIVTTGMLKQMGLI